MTNRSAAARYARALLDVTIKEADPARADADLTAFGALMAAHGDLAHALTTPAVPADRKRALTEALLARFPQISQPVAKLLLLLAERDRLAIVPDLVESFHARLLDHQNIVQAAVTTAAPLDAAQSSALEQQLTSATGKRISMTTRVDASIIGGVVAQIGGTIFDGSVKRQLERLKAELASQN